MIDKPTCFKLQLSKQLESEVIEAMSPQMLNEKAETNLQ
ncbi:hypothetical protein NIES4106_54380 (plasmid) [Fischerella sp. NIES-4106]|jgi:hypothetical protein|nr:hypothetical protein NIES4106_54380 [Fischerella sp. NIES-4106]